MKVIIHGKFDKINKNKIKGDHLVTNLISQIVLQVTIRQYVIEKFLNT